jgi:hypothetical protein
VSGSRVTGRPVCDSPDRTPPVGARPLPNVLSRAFERLEWHPLQHNQ